MRKTLEEYRARFGNAAMEQLPRSRIKDVLRGLGIDGLVAQAINGHAGAVGILAKMSENDPLVRDALLLLCPRWNPKNASRRTWVSLVELGGRRAKGSIKLVQGGSPGMKRR